MNHWAIELASVVRNVEHQSLDHSEVFMILRDQRPMVLDRRRGDERIEGPQAAGFCVIPEQIVSAPPNGLSDGNRFIDFQKTVDEFYFALIPGTGD